MIAIFKEIRRTHGRMETELGRTIGAVAGCRDRSSHAKVAERLRSHNWSPKASRRTRKNLITGRTVCTKNLLPAFCNVLKLGSFFAERSRLLRTLNVLSIAAIFESVRTTLLALVLRKAISRNRVDVTSEPGSVIEEERRHSLISNIKSISMDVIWLLENVVSNTDWRG